MLTGTKNLICKENGRIFVGGKEFNSATSALAAYIDIFKNGNSGRNNKKPVLAYERNIGDLLLPKSCLQLTAERSLDSGVRDTPYEIQLFNQKKEIEKQHANLFSLSTNQDISSQANQTIKETETFLELLQSGRTSPASTCCVSDIGSQTTEYLLSASPYPPKTDLIERDSKGVCKKFGSCSAKKNSKKCEQPISQTPFDGLMKTPLPLPMNSSSPQNSSCANVGKRHQTVEHHAIKSNIYETPKLPSKIKDIGKDKITTDVDSMNDKISPPVELRKVEKFTCTKADWQNIDSSDKSSAFNNSQNAKTKLLKKISNNAMPNHFERTPLLNRTKSESPPQISCSNTKTKSNSGKNIHKSQCKTNSSKNNFCKSVTSQSCKESAKSMKNVPKSKISQQCAVIKTIKSPQERKDKQRTSDNFALKTSQKDTRDIQNSQKILHVAEKSNSQNPSSNKKPIKMSKKIKSLNTPEIISKDIHFSPKSKQNEVSDICDSKDVDSFHLRSNNYQLQNLSKSISPDSQKDQKKSIASPDLSDLSKYKNPQVPNWVKELESSMVASRINSPSVPTDKDAYMTPAQQLTPPNLIKSWSISGIPFTSPEISHNQTPHSVEKDAECKHSEKGYVSPYQKLTDFMKNFRVDDYSLFLDDDALPQLHNQSIQSLLDRYLNDQTKELSKGKSLDTFTDDSLNILSSESGKVIEDSSSHHLWDTTQQSSCHPRCISRPLSPLSCEAVLDDSCFDKNEEMLKFPFISSTPNRDQQRCLSSNTLTFKTKTNPFWNDIKLQNANSDENDQHRCMETLKNMLFKLQVEEELVQSSRPENKSIIFCQSENQKTNSSGCDIPLAKSDLDNLQTSLNADKNGLVSFDSPP